MICGFCCCNLLWLQCGPKEQAQSFSLWSASDDLEALMSTYLENQSPRRTVLQTAEPSIDSAVNQPAQLSRVWWFGSEYLITEARRCKEVHQKELRAITPAKHQSCFDSHCSSTTSWLFYSQISNPTGYFCMVSLVLLLLICLVFFYKIRLNGKYFTTHGKDYYQQLLPALQEMSIHTHICVKLVSPAQLMLSVA